MKNREKEIEGLFSRVSRRYDLLNRILSLGTDVRWRKKLAETVEDGRLVLDVATGTGDVLVSMSRYGRLGSAVGLDISMPMLLLARRKGITFPLVRASSMKIPFKDGVFTWVTVAFGIRNFPDPYLSLLEMHRVLKKGGGISILEFSLPKGRVLRPVYLFYFRRILPAIGALLSDESAYRYLPDSVMRFPKGEKMVQLMRRAGFSKVRFFTLTFGVVTIYVGKKE